MTDREQRVREIRVSLIDTFWIPSKEDARLLLFELDRVTKERDEQAAATLEKMRIANEFIGKYSHRFTAFEDMQEAADVEDGNAWDAAFRDLSDKCAEFGIIARLTGEGEG